MSNSFKDKIKKFAIDKKAIESQGFDVLPSMDGAYIYDPVARRVICHQGEQWDLIVKSGYVNKQY